MTNILNLLDAVVVEFELLQIMVFLETFDLGHQARPQNESLHANGPK